MKLWCDGRHQVSIQSIGFVRSAAHVLSLGIDEQLVICETISGKTVSLKPTPRNPVSHTSVELTIDGHACYAYADAQYDIVIYDIEDDREIHRLVGHTDLVLSLAYCRSKKLLVTGGVDFSMRLWDLVTRKQESLVKHTDIVNCVCVSEKGDFVASGTRSGEVLVWQE